MKRISTKPRPGWVVLLALFCLAAAASFTKDDVVRMARAGRSEQAILDAIHDSHATFDLTANDIAELRQAGVSDKVIDTMTETGPAQPEAAAVPEEQSRTDQSSSDEGIQEQPYATEYYPPPPPIAYPVYPLYYPVYYPVYDPFFPFFGGFFFSFEFVHVSRAFTVFPCDRAVVVASSALVGGRPSPRGAPLVFSTPRATPRGSTRIVQARQTVRGDTIRPPGRIGVPRPTSFSQVPVRPSRFSSPSSARAPARPHGSPTVRPYGSPMVRPHGTPYTSPARPHFQAPPMRPPAPAFHRPPPTSMPHGGSAPMGGIHSHGFGGLHSTGGGHGHDSHH